MEELLRVVVIHRNRLFREGLVAGLTMQPDITVAGEVAEVREFIERFDQLQPDSHCGFCPPRTKWPRYRATDSSQLR